jgi:hypothetical protein
MITFGFVGIAFVAVMAVVGVLYLRNKGNQYQRLPTQL